MKQRHKVVPASYLLVRRNDEILLMLRRNSGYYDGWYGLPSGHVEIGEMPSEAMIREAKEETNITISKTNIHLAHAMFRAAHDETGERADYFFVADAWEGEPVNVEPEKCGELRWCPMDALPENVVHCVRKAIENIRKGIFYSEQGKDELY